MPTLPLPIVAFPHQSWETMLAPERQEEAQTAVETGNVLLFPKLAFSITPLEQRFLSPKFVNPKVKNISYDSARNSLKGVVGSKDDRAQLQIMLARFAQQATMLIHSLFPSYQGELRVARTSFRPVQANQRKTSYRKDDRLLHVDAFPANPNQGKRILRVFTNINPHGEDRVWNLGEPFEAVARYFLPAITRPWPGISQCLFWLRMTKTRRTEYDHIMLQLHNRMKKNKTYQQHVTKTELRLPPGSTWVVQTDHVSHAAQSGQYMLEQTFYLPVTAMADPSLSPLKVLERLVGRELA